MRTHHALFIVLLLVSSGALAQSPFYAGFGAGVATTSIADDVLPITGAPSTTLSKDESDTAFKAYAGIRLAPHVALEAGYVDLGEFSATRTVNAIPAGSVSQTVKSGGPFIDLRGIVPLRGRWELFGKVGFVRTTTKADISASGAVTLGSGVDRSPRVSEWNPRFGIGAEIALARNLALRIEGERTMDVGDRNKTGEGDIDVLAVGLRFSF